MGESKKRKPWCTFTCQEPYQQLQREPKYHHIDETPDAKAFAIYSFAEQLSWSADCPVGSHHISEALRARSLGTSSRSWSMSHADAVLLFFSTPGYGEQSLRKTQAMESVLGQNSHSPHAARKRWQERFFWHGLNLSVNRTHVTLSLKFIPFIAWCFLQSLQAYRPNEGFGWCISSQTLVVPK